MAKTHLLRAACTVAMLAASPVFAQSSTQAGDTGGAAPKLNRPSGRWRNRCMARGWGSTTTPG